MDDCLSASHIAIINLGATPILVALITLARPSGVATAGLASIGVGIAVLAVGTPGGGPGVVVLLGSACLWARATVAAARQLRQRGLERALIGFDDFEVADAFGISVIAHDPAEMGRRAVELAFKRLADPTGLPETEVVPVHYIPRGSGESAPLG